MPLLKNKSAVLIKTESTYGTDPTPTTSANAIVAFDLELTPEIDSLERRDVGLTLSRLKELGGKARAKLKFTTELKGSGTAGTAADDSALWKACGMAVTNVPATSDTYAFTSSTATTYSLTAYVYQDGLRQVVTGAVGNWEINLTAGEIPKVTWELMGLYAAETDTTFITGQTVDSTVPKVCKNLTCTLGSYAVTAESLTLKSNNTIAERPSLSSTYGIAGFQITDRNPEGSITPEAVLLATKDYVTAWGADTVQALSAVLSVAAGNIVTITASQCRIRGMNFADRDGILTREIPFQLGRSSADDEISIAFT